MKSFRKTIRRSARVVVSVVPLLAVSLWGTAAEAVEPGDAGRFNTWTGYDAGRFPVSVAAADFNGDGAADAAWARDEFFEPTLGVQLNLGEGTLAQVVEYPASAQSTDIKTADLEGDGDLDLAMIAEGNDLANHMVDLYENAGNGAFTRRTTTGGTGPAQMVFTDISGDGAPDIAMTNYWPFPEGSVSVLLNNGDGTFAAEDVYGGVGSRPYGIGAADLDGDGDRDLAVARLDDNVYDLTITFLSNDGDGTFTVLPDELVIDAQMGDPKVEAADFDGDGNADLAVGGFSGYGHYILLNTGPFTFAAREYQAGYSSGGMEAVDYDADGDVDLFSATLGSSSTGDISLLVNQGDGTFAQPYTSISSSHQPWDVDSADFNMDGRLDIAVPNRGSSTSAVHPQREDGSFAAPPVFETAAAPTSVATADFDLDGDSDVATTIPTFDTSDSVQVMLNDGSGALTPGQSIPAGGNTPAYVYASHLNGDSAPDLLWVLDSLPYPFVTALNNGDGTFGPQVVHSTDGCDTGQVTTGDVDNDGDQDVLVGINSYSEACLQVWDTVGIHSNNGDGTFAPPTYVQMEFSVEMALGVDLNGDGLTDLASAQKGQGGARDISVALGTGGGTFTEPVHYSTEKQHREISADDLDNDGDLDLTVASFDDTVSVLLNDGTGTFTKPVTYMGEDISGLYNQWAMDVGDINGDGDPDLVVVNYSGNDLGVHFGHGDGTFDQRQLRYGMNTSPRDLQLTDMNGDGLVDVVLPNFVQSNGAGPARGAGPLTAAEAAEAGPDASLGAAAAQAAGGVSVAINGAGALACTVTGTGGADILKGSARDDVICGRGGNDTISGGGGNDVLIGGRGADTLKGGSGADLLQGSEGADTLDARDGVRGNDTVEGGPGRDRCLADRRDDVSC
jgi:hypothetical protein